ncbi:hypothetical protein ACFPRL_15655 [Pseudoclavibacter helvolus]
MLERRCRIPHISAALSSEKVRTVIMPASVSEGRHCMPLPSRRMLGSSEADHLRWRHGSRIPDDEVH